MSPYQILHKHTIVYMFCSKRTSHCISHLRLLLGCNIALRNPFSQNKLALIYIYLCCTQFLIIFLHITFWGFPVNWGRLKLLCSIEEAPGGCTNILYLSAATNHIFVYRNWSHVPSVIYFMISSIPGKILLIYFCP